MPAIRDLAIGALLTTVTLPLVAAQANSLSSSKRGLVYVDPTGNGDDSLWTSGDLTWYYNYKPNPTPALAGSNLQFVPMLWGTSIGSTDMSFYNTVKGLIQSGKNITYVLGYNEPDGCKYGGSCVDAQTAAETWIRQLEPLRKEFGVKLGAPAVTGAPTGFVWLQNFFTWCNGQCHADFVSRTNVKQALVE